MFLTLAIISLAVAFIAKYYGDTALSEESKKFAKWFLYLALLSFAISAIIGLIVKFYMHA